MKAQKYKQEYEVKSAEAKKSIKNCLKLCDYILSWAVFPDSFKQQ